MKKKLRFKGFFKAFMILAVLGFGQLGFGQTPVPMSLQPGNTYSENFSDIANWTNNFASGIGANRWASYPITTGGNANDGKRTTKSSASFSTSSGGGVQKGTGNLVFLSTGSSTTSEAVAVDLLLDFTGVNAGTLSFDWSAIDNGNGTRPTSLRVYWSIDNSNFTELTAAQILNVLSSSTGTISSIALPSDFNNTSTARIRFYNHAGSITGSGNRDKIAIDNITVTCSAANSAPVATGVGVSGTTNVGETLVGTYDISDAEGDELGTPIFKWYRADNAAGLNETAIAGATSSSFTLTIDDLNKFIRFGVVPVATEGTLTGTETFSDYVGSIGLGSTPNFTISGSLNEATLNNATVTLTLANETFIDATLDSSNFTLNNAPSGVSIASVNYIDPSSASLTLAYDNTDFDSNITDFNITISAVELTASNPLTSNNLTINGLVETLTVGTISSFGSQCVNLLSAEQSFTISGSNLKAGTITLAALSGFSYSETANGVYTSTLSFSNTAGTLTNKTIFVKFLPTAVQSYNGNIVVSSVGAPNVNRSVVGSGINTLPVITTPTSTSITDSSATLGGNITVVGCSSITERGIYYSTVSGFANGDGTKVSTVGTYSTGVFTIPVTGLSSNTVYYYKAFASSASGTVYTTQGTFTTNVLPVNVPYFQDFEGATNDFVLDATGTNRWTIGTGTNNGGTKALYISNNGSANTYTFNSTQNGTFASLQVDLSSIANATLSFDWRSNGEEFDGIVYDYGEVYVNAGSGDILVSNANEFNNALVFDNKQIDLSSFVGGVITVKFKWVNDSSAGNQPPFAVDNVSILPYGLPVLTTSSVSDITYNSAVSGGTVTSDGGDLITARGIVYATTINPTLTDNVINNGSDLGTFVSNLTGLNSNTTYYVRAFATNTNGTYYGNEESFTTPAIDAPVATAATTIGDTSFIANWDAVSGADAYLLDVISGFENQSITETFSSIGGGTSSGYNDRTWTGTNGITWTAYNSRTDQVINSGNDAITLRDASSSYIESGSINGIPTSISFEIQQKFGGLGGSVALKILSGVGFSTSTTIGNYPFNTSIETINATISGITGPFKIVIENDGITRPCIDNLTFDVSTVTYVAGFENLNIGNVLTHTVTDLETGTKYYYRVRAIDANSVSQNSNTIEVTTTGTVRWTGATNTNWSTASNWSNDLVPDGTYDIEIPSGNPVLDTAFTVATGSDLTISGTGSLTIAPTASLTVVGTTDFDNKSVILQSDATGTATIGEVSGTLSNATNVTVERYIPAKRAWRALTAPLRGSNGSLYATWQNGGSNIAGTGVEMWGPSGTNLATGPNYSVLNYTPTGWVGVNNTATTNLFDATNNNAYLVFVSGAYGNGNITSGASATTLKATGELITGNLNYTIDNTVNTRHTLIGNPYASPLNPSQILDGSTNLVSKFWLWDPALATTGAYVSYDDVLSTYSNTTGSYPTSGTNVQSGQAIFVIATSGNSGTLTLTESKKATGVSNVFGKIANQNLDNSNTASILRFGLFKETNQEWRPLDGAIAGFYDTANNSVDNNDGKKLANGAENIAFVRNNTTLSSEHFSNPQPLDEMYVRVWNTSVNTYKLRINTESFTVPNIEATLVDLFTGVQTPIALDGSVQEYTFAVTSAAASTGDRFKVVFSASALSTATIDSESINVYPNPATNGSVNVQLPVGDYNNFSYELVNVLGQKVMSDTIEALSGNEFSINTKGLANNWYALRILQSGKTVYQTKIIIAN
jgi:hypothetical protein